MASTLQIIQGTWDEIAEHADEFRGRQLTVIVTEERPIGAEPIRSLDPKNAEAIAYLQARLKNVLTDPEEIRQTEAEQAELINNLNRNRIEAGERPLFPE